MEANRYMGVTRYVISRNKNKIDINHDLFKTSVIKKGTKVHSWDERGDTQ